MADELEVDPSRLSDETKFVHDIFEFFYPGFSQLDNVDSKAADLASEMLWEAIEGSRMMDLVPRPPGFPPGLGWLASQVVQMAFRVGMDEGIYVAVRNVVAAKHRTDYEMLRAGI